MHPMRTSNLCCLIHLPLELLYLLVVSCEAVCNGRLEVVNGHKVREEGKNVLNLQQTACTATGTWATALCNKDTLLLPALCDSLLISCRHPRDVTVEVCAAITADP